MISEDDNEEDLYLDNYFANDNFLDPEEDLAVALLAETSDTADKSSVTTNNDESTLVDFNNDISITASSVNNQDDVIINDIFVTESDSKNDLKDSSVTPCDEESDFNISSTTDSPVINNQNSLGDINDSSETDSTVIDDQNSLGDSNDSSVTDSTVIDDQNSLGDFNDSSETDSTVINDQNSLGDYNDSSVTGSTVINEQNSTVEFNDSFEMDSAAENLSIDYQEEIVKFDELEAVSSDTISEGNSITDINDIEEDMSVDFGDNFFQNEDTTSKHSNVTDNSSSSQIASAILGTREDVNSTTLTSTQTEEDCPNILFSTSENEESTNNVYENLTQIIQKEPAKQNETDKDIFQLTDLTTKPFGTQIESPNSHIWDSSETYDEDAGKTTTFKPSTGKSTLDR